MSKLILLYYDPLNDGAFGKKSLICVLVKLFNFKKNYCIA